jgi:hypothetical protein
MLKNNIISNYNTSLTVTLVIVVLLIGSDSPAKDLLIPNLGPCTLE